jgi:hypothetical protein
MDRDILLVAVGGLIGALSSLATIFASYILEGMRLRRQWQREDQLRLAQKREELQQALFAAEAAEQKSGSESQPVKSRVVRGD